MEIKTQAIIISSLKFQEKSLIVKCFTKSNGLLSFIVRDAFSFKKNSSKRAYFQPLTILNIDGTHKKNGFLGHFKEIKIAYPFVSIQNNIIKSTMILFLSEVLQNAIKEEEKNESFFVFLETALHWLDKQNFIPNFHIILLLEITKFLGFYPDISNIENAFFEINEGKFISTQSIKALTEHETSLFKKLISLRLDNTEKIFSNSERQSLLNILMQYYHFHLPDFKTPKSIAVLKEVFS